MTSPWSSVRRRLSSAVLGAAARVGWNSDELAAALRFALALGLGSLFIAPICWGLVLLIGWRWFAVGVVATAFLGALAYETCTPAWWRGDR